MEEPLVITSALLAALVILFFLKIYILFRAARNKTVRRWFYFTQQEIVLAPTPASARMRRLQNITSVLFVILLIPAGVFLYLFRKQ